ncbi:unnamed protein product [Ascophyllum nodosum]
MLVAYNAGQFNANNARGASGSAAGFDSSSSAALGSTTPSNFPSETGAVFGSNPAGSSYGGGGDSGAGFAPSDLFAPFGSAPGSEAPQAPEPNQSHASIISVTRSSSRGPKRASSSQDMSDFGSWMSSVQGTGLGADPFAPSPAAGYANGRLPVVRESPSFASSNGGGGGLNPFGPPQPSTATSGGFPSQERQPAPGTGAGAAGATPSTDVSDLFSFTSSASGGGSVSGGDWTGGRSTRGGFPLQRASVSASGSAAFSDFSSAGPQQPVPVAPPMQQPLPQQQQQSGMFWQAQQDRQQQRQQQPQRADPFADASIVPAARGSGRGGSGGNPTPFTTDRNDPFTQLPAASTGPGAGGGHSATGSGNDGSFSQALVLHGGGDGGASGGGGRDSTKFNPFDDQSGATTTFGPQQQAQQQRQQQQQLQPHRFPHPGQGHRQHSQRWQQMQQPQQAPQAPFQQAPQLQSYGQGYQQQQQPPPQQQQRPQQPPDHHFV